MIYFKCQNLALCYIWCQIQHNVQHLSNLMPNLTLHWRILFMSKCQILALAHKFGIALEMLLALCIAFAKFNVKFGIALENIFYIKITNFSIDTQIQHCIGDALTISFHYIFFDFFQSSKSFYFISFFLIFQISI